MEENWQLKIFQKSLKKRQRVSKIIPIIPDLGEKKCLELGCARGIIGYHLRQCGGKWVSVDTDLINLSAAQRLLRKGVMLANPFSLPFPDQAFDLIAVLDILEHLEDDENCINEIHRLLKPGGRLVVSAPTSGRLYLVNRIKNLIGLTPDVYGHVREGYDPDVLALRLKEKGYYIRRVETFTKFFTEFVEMLINFGYIYILRRKKAGPKRDGAISPSSEEELKQNIKVFKVYSLLFPFTWLFAQLDYILFFLKGYTILIQAEKK
ncbi:class I SAM-dependent methyltransferase [candidate division CSSED10-310 bacterium]|uniref:Class I SAM-dependent methyltransferase n=1 Tax=candidate division CSSED10-310 bacterium TaxID=2855610 RepID=A0ABV6YTZ3_UNCC1